jgi:transcriptional regulator with XRE-family HTH domain
LSQAQLADAVNLAQGSLSDLENGRFAYTQGVLESLAKVLRCSPADLLERPPGLVDEIRDALDALDPDSQKRALAVVKALKDSEAA